MLQVIVALNSVAALSSAPKSPVRTLMR